MRPLKRLMRLIKPRRKQENKVHFIFHSHGKGEPFPRRQPNRGTSVGIIESARGNERHDSIEELAGIPEKYDEYRRQAAQRVIRVIGGEQLDKGALRALRQRQSDTDTLFDIADSDPALKNIKLFFSTFAQANQMRHRAIKNTIKRELKRGETIEATYGTTHSTLIPELRKRGIHPTRRKIGPFQFDKMSTIVRRLTLNPRERISDEEYYKGFLSIRIFDEISNRIIFTGADIQHRMIIMLANTIIDELREGEVQTLLRNKQGVAAAIKKRVDFRNAGAYLEKHSPFWRRLNVKQKRELLDAI
ncbi:MAG: hypothetical protein AABW68_00625 [archaeon]